MQQQQDCPAPAPIFNHRKRPRQAVIADHITNQDDFTFRQDSGPNCDQQFMDSRMGTAGYQSFNTGQYNDGQGHVNVRPQDNLQGRQRFSRTPGYQPGPGPAGAAAYNDLMPVGGFSNSRRPAQRNNVPSNQGAACVNLTGQRNTGPYNSVNDQGRSGNFQRNSFQPMNRPMNSNNRISNAVSSNYSMNSSMDINNSMNSNYMYTNNNCMDSNMNINNSMNNNSMNNNSMSNSRMNNMVNNQQQGSSRNLSNRQTFTRNSGAMNTYNNGGNATQAARFQSQNNTVASSQQFRNMQIPDPQGNSYQGNNSRYTFQGQGQRFSSGVSNVSRTQNSKSTVNLAAAAAVTGPTRNQQGPGFSRSQTFSSGQVSNVSGNTRAIMATDQRQKDTSYRHSIQSPPKPDNSKTAGSERKTAAMSQTDRGVIVLTVDVMGIHRWSKYKDSYHIMFEFYGYLDSAVARGVADSKEFMLRDGQKEPVNCIFYEIDRPMPKMVRGQWQRVVGTYDRRSEKLRCLSVRPVGEPERSLLATLTDLSKQQMLRLTKTSREM